VLIKNPFNLYIDTTNAIYKNTEFRCKATTTKDAETITRYSEAISITNNLAIFPSISAVSVGGAKYKVKLTGSPLRDLTEVSFTNEIGSNVVNSSHLHLLKTSDISVDKDKVY
jgi:hypothetical protein